ncbi:MAG: hypothetical protein ABEJ95_05820 [Candidatus Nanohalobium sp.]
MDFKIREEEEGYMIEVEASAKVAVAVRSSSGERIYLSGEGGSDSTYYSEEPDYLEPDSGKRTVRHPEKPEEVHLIG